MLVECGLSGTRNPHSASNSAIDEYRMRGGSEGALAGAPMSRRPSPRRRDRAAARTASRSSTTTSVRVTVPERGQGEPARQVDDLPRRRPQGQGLLEEGKHAPATQGQPTVDERVARPYAPAGEEHVASHAATLSPGRGAVQTPRRVRRRR